jgi:hypothetical protein
MVLRWVYIPGILGRREKHREQLQKIIAAAKGAGIERSDTNDWNIWTYLKYDKINIFYFLSRSFLFSEFWSEHVAQIPNDELGWVR